MEIINYILSVIVVFLGLIIGIVIAKYTKEELKSGKKYFVLLQNVFLLIIFVLLLSFFKLNLIFIIVLGVLFIISLILFIKLKKSIIMYNLLAIVLFISSFKELYFIYISSLVFLYGIPTGSLFYSKGNLKKFFLYYVWFLVISLLLLFYRFL